MPLVIWHYFHKYILSFVIFGAILKEAKGEGQQFGFGCGEAEFTCSPGVCVTMAGRCDGVPDCANGLDEASCEEFAHVKGRGCVIPAANVACTSKGFCDRYRSVTGQCNNRLKSSLGQAVTEVVRLLPPDYQDGFDAPRGGGINGGISTLPNPRSLVVNLHPDKSVDFWTTNMFVIFGQILDHDITEIIPADDGFDCCFDSGREDECFQITVDLPDPFYSKINRTGAFMTCRNLKRSEKVCEAPGKKTRREQRNELTSFLDASVVYASHEEDIELLRSFEGGLLRTNADSGKLPTRKDLGLVGGRGNTRSGVQRLPQDFVAGDNRVNENPFLTTLHALLLLEHNRIAGELESRLPRRLRKDEVIFQEARRLLIAQWQNVIYQEWLPALLGEKNLGKFDLDLGNMKTVYDPKTNPSVINSFSIAFRFAHSMLRNVYLLISKLGRKTFWRLRDVFNGAANAEMGPSGDTPDSLPITAIARGLLADPANTVDEFIAGEVTNHLFQRNSEYENFGQDLMSFNIQRGRDHGLPGYIKFRKLCGLSSVSWRRTPPEFSDTFWEKMREAYESVADIDLFVAGIAEKNVPGGSIGPTFACIIGEQFKRLKNGDRFFFSHTSGKDARGLGPVAKTSVAKRTFFDVLCDNTDIESGQRQTFLLSNASNPIASCTERNQLNFDEIVDEIVREIGESFNGDCEGKSHKAKGIKCRRDECYVKVGNQCCNCITCCNKCF